jgi:hypothetical protein
MTQLKSRKDLVYAFTALSLIASLNGSTADDKYVCNLHQSVPLLAHFS